jgi:hypothetical protein
MCLRLEALGLKLDEWPLHLGDYHQDRLRDRLGYSPKGYLYRNSRMNFARNSPGCFTGSSPICFPG